MDVSFVKFMSSGNSGEDRIFRKIPNIHYRCPGKHGFLLSLGTGVFLMGTAKSLWMACVFYSSVGLGALAFALICNIKKKRD